MDKITVTDDGTAIIKTSITVTPKFDIGKRHHVTADNSREKGKDEATMNWEIPGLPINVKSENKTQPGCYLCRDDRGNLKPGKAPQRITVWKGSHTNEFRCSREMHLQASKRTGTAQSWRANRPIEVESHRVNNQFVKDNFNLIKELWVDQARALAGHLHTGPLMVTKRELGQYQLDPHSLVSSEHFQRTTIEHPNMV